MSTAPSGYLAPKQDWDVNDGIADTDLNLIGDNINAIETGDRTLAQEEPFTNVGSLRELLDYFAFQIKVLAYNTNWYDEIGQIFYMSGCAGGEGIAHASGTVTYDVQQVRVYLTTTQSLWLENAKYGITYAGTSPTVVELNVTVGSITWASASYTDDESPNYKLEYAGSNADYLITVAIKIADSGAGTIDRKSGWSLRFRVMSNEISYSSSVSPSRSNSLSQSTSPSSSESASASPS